MGHEKHLLEGIILDSNNFAESGRIIKILTKDFGVMSLVATGVRELKSKMKASLEILNLVDFEFVEGQEVNRLVGVFPKEKFSEILMSGGGKEIISKRRAISNVVNFILRTVVGQTQNEKLWDSFLEGLNYLKQLPPPLTPPQAGGEQLQIFEIIWLIKILVALGYWEEGRYDKFLEENFNYFTNVEDGEVNRKNIIDEINQSIRSTHL